MEKPFPKPLALPHSVASRRRRRQRQLLRAALWGGGIRCAVIVAELLGFFWFNSAALLLDAFASLIDVLSTLVLVLCIWLAERPPDENHPFGHGRYEPLAGLQLSFLLILVGGGLFWQQGIQLVPHAAEPLDPRAWMIPFGAVLLLEWSYRQAMRAARKAGSAALVAEAWHYRIDALNSLIATLALGVAALFPQWGGFFDHLGALTIAGCMLIIGLKASRENLRQLMDHVPTGEFFVRVKEASGKVKGVKGTEKIRIQRYGPDAHVDIDVEVDPDLTVEEAHRISQRVRVEIQKEWSAVRDVTVHIEPYYENDH